MVGKGLTRAEGSVNGIHVAKSISTRTRTRSCRREGRSKRGAVLGAAAAATTTTTGGGGGSGGWKAFSRESFFLEFVITRQGCC